MDLVLRFIKRCSAGQNAASLEGTLSHLRTLFSLVNVPFPSSKFFGMLTKKVQQQKGLPKNRGAVCPHDWLPVNLTTQAICALPWEVCMSLTLCIVT